MCFCIADESYLDTTLDWIPGMKDACLMDFPFARNKDPDNYAFRFLMDSAEGAVRAPAIIVHTFDALEPDVLDGLSSIFPRVYAIGPYQLLLNQIPEDGLKSIGYSLRKEDGDCLQWLDTKEPKSVVYVNFGSLIVLKPEQLVEFAMGLANSKHPFLWIIRSDLVIDFDSMEEGGQKMTSASMVLVLTICTWDSQKSRAMTKCDC
ncbi:hypothetical protein OIU77_020887 [Salix suchowensis]|uniref:Uncharacterized protein n=1 Tax=Salix suchowensis TaxID=1278906 RepID=A0ABQ9C8S0_9ROSI|nr:hypothetical protein OIU77_020887 [Salix suchowensis]